MLIDCGAKIKSVMISGRSNKSPTSFAAAMTWIYLSDITRASARSKVLAFGLGVIWSDLSSREQDTVRIQHTAVPRRGAVTNFHNTADWMKMHVL
jgi:hypothetical protein